MKKFLLAAFLLLSANVALADANDISFMQRNPTNTGYITRIPLTPTDGSSVIFMFNGTTYQTDGIPKAGYAIIGSGLSYDGTTLSATGGAGAAGAAGPQGPIGLTGATGPAGAAAPTFNFSAPAARTLAVSTQYQAADVTKAAITTVSASCTNSSTLVAASACTLQVRQSATTGLTCSTGTVSMTWTSTVALGLVLTQTSGSPFDVKVPIGGYFILCATAGTFTMSAVEQTAG